MRPSLEGFPDHALFLHRSDRSRMSLQGDRARDVLNGLVTNDVSGLAVGAGAYAATLTPKGKLLTDLRVFARHNDLLIDVPPQGAHAWWGMVRKYINPRLAKYVDLTESLDEILVFGRQAETVLSGLGVSLPDGADYSGSGTADLWVARVPDLGITAASLFFPASERPSVQQKLAAAGAVEDTGEYAERARIEAGRPVMGIDMDDTSLVQEVGLERLSAISYDKGCYTGQETVARLHFRGHVNKRLMGLQLSTSVPRGARLSTEAVTLAGDVRSTVHSPVFGHIALAMVRREVAAADAVGIQWENGNATATVVELPFS